MENPITPQDTKPKEDLKEKKWLEDISQQSWNPELIISGFAIYATLSLPDLIHQIYNNYATNYQINDLAGNEIIPMLIAGILISICQLLSITFVIHFILRGFWVGYLGVLSVFPKGVDFEKVTTLGNYGKEKLKSKMKDLDTLAIQLDRASSIIFAIAIIIVLQFMGVGFMYLAFVIFYSILQNILGVAVYSKYSNFIEIGAFAVMSIPVIALIILNRKSLRNHPKYGVWHYNLSTRFQKIVMPFFSTHIQSLALTFYSRIPRWKTTLFSLLVGFTFVFMMSFNMLQIKNAGYLFSIHHFYTPKLSEVSLSNSHYEDKRSTNTPRIATIPSDVITTPYIKLFIAYPKKMDKYLDSLYKKPKDTLSKKSKYEHKRAFNRLNMTYLEDFYTIQLNDSIFAKKELMYYEFSNGEKGMMMYIPSKVCKQGKNQIKIIVKRKYKPEEKPYEALIPFWY